MFRGTQRSERIRPERLAARTTLSPRSYAAVDTLDAREALLEKSWARLTP